MQWLIGMVMVVVGFSLNRLWEWWKKRWAGLTGQAHNIIKKLGKTVQSFDGYYYLSNNPTGNFKIAKHVYEHAVGGVISTCFRENPMCYGEQDLARLLPKGAFFSRLTTDCVCSLQEKELTQAVLENSPVNLHPR
jgi:hypothetical protein